ncbi:glycerate kinase [Campylobacter ureolyticus]|uniref:glycerate kinase n=1 Tax=Campylobacter ureolyticus TaxID=827 RepID=UPI0022B427F2|nr:glycerate kinase [Campylobacter ureolyticus]MCZ6105080.1 glycerate kinase [Campylobacter ureolyticus]MCZ6157888.1 glycerate kinase [Campylobacter ureolyticus]
MKVLVAIDSFKGSLTSIEAGNAVKSGISSLCDEVVVIGIADGGEGSLDTIANFLGANFDEILTFDPLFRQIKAKYAYKDDLAILEMSQSSGLNLLKKDEQNPYLTSTYGLGIMIKDAILKGRRNFIIGIGGSATNDAGTGMLEALGFSFFDKNDNLIKANGQNLIKISKISDKNTLKELKECKFKIACDVNNPLYGKNGAAYVYAAQKGASNDMIKNLDLGLINFSKVVHKFIGIDNSSISGSGAAGGLGFGFMSFLNAELLRGFEIISKIINLEEKIKNADLIITGEGKLDAQSSMGKVPSEVAKLAKKHSKKVVALGGAVDEGFDDELFNGAFCILDSPISLEEAMKKEIAKANLTKISRQILKLLK